MPFYLIDVHEHIPGFHLPPSMLAILLENGSIAHTELEQKTLV